jgi:isorenieratene synthase
VAKTSIPGSDQLLSRRSVFKIFALSSVAGLLAYSRFAKPIPTVVEQDPLVLPRQLSSAKSVVIVGGGLAGLASAHELSRRGFRVTLLERSPQLGGKIASWNVQALGKTFTVEHGFHGFFPQYYNLKSVMADLDASSNFRSLDSYAVVYKDNYKPEVFRPSHSAFPWNIVDLSVASPNLLSWGLNLTKYAHWQVFKEIAGFDASKSFARLDHMSVSEWVTNDFPKGLFDLYFLPFAKSSLNSPDILSAGELMQFFHFYFFGNPEGLAFQGTRQDMGTSVVQPLAKGIQAHGGQIITQATIQSIRWEEGRIKDMVIRQGNGRQAAPFWVKPVAIPPTGSAVTQAMTFPDLYSDGEQNFAVDRGSKSAISLTCTHQGCSVQPSADGTYRCPCHGAQFARSGQVIKGPAERDLPRFRVMAMQKDELQLKAETTRILEESTSIAADYYIFATDVPGTKGLFRRCEGDVNADLASKIDGLAIADPFAVLRLWFDRDFPWEHSNFTSLSGYRLTDSVSLYHRIQDDYIAWSKETGGSVVELHAYCYKESEFPDQQSLVQTFKQELFTVIPELKEAKILHQEIVNQKNFSGYPPNSYAQRPSTVTDVANLFLAGDWVKMPFPCGLMERAVSSGLLAANSILQQEGLQRRPLLSVNPKGVLSPFTGVPVHEV